MRLEKVLPQDLKAFKAMFQEAFQKGYEDKYGKCEGTILPEEDIDASLKTKGAVAYKAMIDDEMVGGAVIVINDNQINDLHLLCVKVGTQSKGIGRQIWFEIEKLYPDTKKWHTCTPYFETRNIHFYVNVCGFHITEFFNEHHPMKDCPDDFIGDGGDGMFGFIKDMKK